MTEFVRPSYTAMSQRLRALDGPSRVVDGLAFRVLDEAEGDVWCDIVDRDDDVWNRRDPEDRAAWDTPPAFTTSFDIVLARKIPGIRLVGLAEQPLGDGLDPDWRAWRCEVAIAPGLRAESFAGIGANPAIALLDALFQVSAFLAGEPTS